MCGINNDSSITHQPRMKSKDEEAYRQPCARKIGSKKGLLCLIVGMSAEVSFISLEGVCVSAYIPWFAYFSA